MTKCRFLKNLLTFLCLATVLLSAIAQPAYADTKSIQKQIDEQMKQTYGNDNPLNPTDNPQPTAFTDTLLGDEKKKKIEETYQAVKDQGGYVVKDEEKPLDIVNSIFGEENVKKQEEINEAIEEKEKKQEEEKKKQEEAAAAENEDKEKCYTEAGTMGWIICPIIYGMGEATKGLYEFVEPHLRVEDTILKDFTNQDGGSYSAWSIFRDFANIVFVIILLVVIISQVTGVGVSNYGIKKILPRLVVTAILVNLSFILCRVAVDISNIVGSSINDLFTSIASSEQLQMEIDATAATPAATIGIIVEALLAILGIVGGFAAIVSAVSAQGWALIIPILLTFVVILAGVALAAIVLAVRQALVIIMTVLSPVAIVLYLLPNTSNVTTKWLKLFEGILLTYPICGLLIGGGNLAAHIILHANSGDFFLLLTGAIVCVAPYFFIPSLIMKSVNAFGNIGAKIMAGRQAVRGGVSKLKQSEGYQRKMTNWSSRGLMKPNGLRARFARRVGGSTQMAAARSIAAAQKQDMMDRQAAASLRMSSNPDATAGGFIGEMNENTTGNELMQILENAAAVDLPHATDALAAYLNTHNVSREQRQTIRQFMQGNQNFMNAMHNRNRDAENMIMDANYQHDNLRDYTAALSEPGAMNNNDWTTQNAHMLERAAAAGGLSADAAQTLLSSTDDNIVNGMLSDQSRRRTLEAVAGGAGGPGGVLDSAPVRENYANDQDYQTAVAQHRSQVDNAVARSQTQQQAAQDGEVLRVRHAGMSMQDLTDIYNNAPNTLEGKRAGAEYQRRVREDLHRNYPQNHPNP